MIQGGDPSGVGDGGESIYGGTFADEFHSRLKFSHRGILAMANTGIVIDNCSQFFITLDEQPQLDRKHTIFGRVAGDTIYNVVKIGELPTNKENRPSDSLPKVLRALVIQNPYDDIIPRAITGEKGKEKEKTEVPKVIQPKRSIIKNKQLISFNDYDDEDDEFDAPMSKPKMKSVYDIDKSKNSEKVDENQQNLKLINDLKQKK